MTDTHRLKIAEITNLSERPDWAQQIYDYAKRDKRGCAHLVKNPGQRAYWNVDRLWRCQDCYDEVIELTSAGCTWCGEAIGAVPHPVKVGWDNRVVEANMCGSCLRRIVVDIDGRGKPPPEGGR